MRGVVNLLIMLLLITNIKNVLTSLQQNGFTLREVVMNFIEAEFKPENYVTLGGWMMLPIFGVISFVVEYLAARNLNSSLVFILIVINQVSLLTFPIVFSYRA